MNLIRNGILFLVAIAAIFVVRDIARTLHKQKKPYTLPKTPYGQKEASLSFTSLSSGSRLYWQARHETGDLEEYSWWPEKAVSTGIMKVMPDPTGSGRGNVLSGEITAASPPGGDSHRLYPVLLLPECYRGAYRSRFEVRADLPPTTEQGWYSFATYTNKQNWQDLFGVNLGVEKGENRLILFHVPVVGKGTYTKISSIPFPLRQWVTLEVQVDNSGILLYQDDHLIAEAVKQWGPEGVGLCEAHWGMYGQGKNRRGTILNGSINIRLDQPFDKPPRMVRDTGSAGKKGRKP
jgi:hypothetical protein